MARILAVLIGIILPLALASSSARSSQIRPPVWAGKFYPAKQPKLEDIIRSYANRVEDVSERIPADSALKALIMPHAGHRYCGRTAASACRLLENGDWNKVVLLGPDHRIGLSGAAVTNATAYRTPLGLVPLHPDAAKLRREHRMIKAIPPEKDTEHSLEVILPWLQWSLRDFTLVPVLFGSGEAKQYTPIIQSLLNKETLLLVSSDLSHFLPYKQAVSKDRKSIELIREGKWRRIAASRNRACGKLPIAILLRIAETRDWRPVLLRYSNSGDATGKTNKVVGYAAVAFFGPKDKNPVTEAPDLAQDKAGLLLDLARHAIAEKLVPEQTAPLPDSAREALSDPAFQRKRGVFVTLYTQDRLRGCMGSIRPQTSIRRGVKENALRAAFRDPRFPPLSAGEWEKLRIEISLLSTPERLKYSDPEELVSRLSRTRPGVILQKSSAMATYLPQVWDKISQPELFLSRLCEKAGLSADAWKQGHITIDTYRVQKIAQDG